MFFVSGVPMMVGSVNQLVRIHTLFRPPSRIKRPPWPGGRGITAQAYPTGRLLSGPPMGNVNPHRGDEVISLRWNK